MDVRNYLIAGGNATALVSDCPLVQRQTIATNLLQGKIEQVGFIEASDMPSLTMMGGELCINATLAFASQLSATGQLHTSGLLSIIYFSNHGNETSIVFQKDYSREGNIVIFSGIGFECITASDQPNKSRLQAFCKKYSLPAFGLIQYRDNKISPYVYVQELDSLVHETACGSGSIAASIVTGHTAIVQPTGKIINITIDRETIKLQAAITALA